MKRDTPKISPLPLHTCFPLGEENRHELRDALQPLHPALLRGAHELRHEGVQPVQQALRGAHHLPRGDRKSTRLNSSHANISYAVFCLKKNINIPSYTSPTSLT